MPVLTKPSPSIAQAYWSKYPIFEYTLRLFDKLAAGWHLNNKYGAITIKTKTSSPKIVALTQLLQNGENWGLSKAFHCSSDKDQNYVPNVFLEEQMRETICQYVAFAKDALKLKPPIAIDFGANGLSGYGLTHSQSGWTNVARFHDDTLMMRAILDSFNEDPLDAAIETFLDSLYDLAGLSCS